MRRLFLAVLLLAALLTKTDPGSAHEYSRFGTVESLVERQTFQLDDSTFIDTVDKVRRGGHYYSHQPPLLAVIEAPVYLSLRVAGLRFNNRGRFVMTYLFILLTNGVALALTVVVFAKLLELAGVAARHRDLYAALLVLGTWLLPYGIVSNNHGISGMLVAVLVWQLLLVEWQGSTPRRAAAIGSVLGLLVAIELLPAVSFLPLTVIYLAARPDISMRQWMLIAAGVAVPLLMEAALNVRITGDIIPAGFHHELFNYPGSVFDESSLTGTVKFDSWRALAEYAWAALFAGKGFFSFAPLQLLGLAAGLIEWRWWGRARGVHLVLLGSIVLSLAAALLTTNNFGGEAVGFRHGVFLAPAFVTLLLPWLVNRGEARQPFHHATIAIACVSVSLLLIFAVRQPWSVLTLETHPIGTWDQYLPMLARILTGNLLNP
jgi:drug/metabolite transporter superfamily protein YnfA